MRVSSWYCRQRFTIHSPMSDDTLRPSRDNLERNIHSLISYTHTLSLCVCVSQLTLSLAKMAVWVATLAGTVREEILFVEVSLKIDGGIDPPHTIQSPPLSTATQPTH